MEPDLHDIPTILLIDDDKDDWHFCEEALMQISPRIPLRCMEDTDQLLKTIESTKPSLIFIDFHLGKENGIDCVRKIKAHQQFQAIPVILWSTTSTPQQVAEAYKAGAQLYMEKPWDVKELEEQLKKILRQYGKGFPPASPIGLDGVDTGKKKK